MLRSLGDLAFKADSLAARRPLMESMAREILEALGDRRECELIEEVAMQLPMRILFRLLGVCDEDYAHVVELTNTLTLANDPDFAETGAAAYVHAMYLDDEAPIAGGRELWGFPKKLASPRLAIEKDTLLGVLKYGRVPVTVATMG